MAEYIVEQNNEIDFGATGMSAILQNVRTIMTTTAGTVPMARGLGIDPTPIDGPLAITQARMTAAIVEAVQTYEPRVQVVSVKYNEDHQEGRLTPIVTVALREEVSL